MVERNPPTQQQTTERVVCTVCGPGRSFRDQIELDKHTKQVHGTKMNTGGQRPLPPAQEPAPTPQHQETPTAEGEGSGSDEADPPS